MSVEIRYLTTLRELDAGLWSERSPFLSKAFWLALEDSGALSAPQQPWFAQHVLLSHDGVQIACLPLFAKAHHQGEYVFDQGWADAYMQAGGDYYPRLVTCVPFTPVIGARVFLAAGVALNDVLSDLLKGVQALALRLNASSWHGLFLDDVQRDAFVQVQELPLAQRLGVQFLWENRSYADFDGFCAHLTTKRRKMVRAEQRKVREQAISCAFIEGANIARDDWAFFYACYAATYKIRGREPYLSLAFFEQLGQTMAHQLVLEVATHESGERVAAALFFKDAHTLYGRYWGALYDVSCLHFEVCYYQGIAYAIAQGLRYFDPGTQGEHKLARGFAPVFTHSLHWLADAGFMRAVQDFVARERHGVSGYLAECVANLPFKLKDSEP